MPTIKEIYELGYKHGKQWDSKSTPTENTYFMIESLEKEKEIWVLHHASWTIVFEHGLHDGKENKDLYTNLPVKVTGKRIGKIPECGQSYNSRDQKSEPGVSVLGLINDKGRLIKSNDGSYEAFAPKNKKRIKVEGYLNQLSTGSDGEPLLLFANEVK